MRRLLPLVSAVVVVDTMPRCRGDGEAGDRDEEAGPGSDRPCRSHGANLGSSVSLD